MCIEHVGLWVSDIDRVALVPRALVRPRQTGRETCSGP